MRAYPPRLHVIHVIDALAILLNMLDKRRATARVSIALRCKAPARGQADGPMQASMLAYNLFAYSVQYELLYDMRIVQI